MGIIGFLVLGSGFKCDDYIAKRFDCEKMHRGNLSGFRITFIYCSLHKAIHFIEIYFKGKTEKEIKKESMSYVIYFIISNVFISYVFLSVVLFYIP
jgi:hypothetical protein